MTKLEAVNTLLRSIGTRPVTSITVGHPDVVDAVAVLERWTRTCLERGWWFNIMNSVELQPDANKFIQFPSNVIRFEYSDTCTRLLYPHIAKRENRLLNAATNSFQWKSSVTLDLYIDLDWEDLAYSAQLYIMYSAAAEFVRDKIEDTAKEMKLEKKAMDYYAELDAEEMRTVKYNMFDNPATADVRRGRRPFIGTGRLR
ncbi:hypothetical protein phiV141_34 [Vibrio phage phiV141]|uniref:Tail tubular protein A n=1 Tax=Vibrio phage phiV141 TaxID=2723905 RepID=A0A7D7JVP0_9CAUD|nr:hypothetical protein phiV141_34 [Vibrio phage phiV141]